MTADKEGWLRALAADTKVTRAQVKIAKVIALRNGVAATANLMQATGLDGRTVVASIKALVAAGYLAAVEGARHRYRLRAPAGNDRPSSKMKMGGRKEGDEHDDAA